MYHKFNQEDITETIVDTVTGYNVSTGKQLSNLQWAYIMNVAVDFLSSEEMATRRSKTATGGMAIGLFFQVENQIYVSAEMGLTQQKGALSHEYLHAISYITTGDVDKYHANRSFWCSKTSAEHVSAKLFDGEEYAYTEATVAHCNMLSYGSTNVGNLGFWEENKVNLCMFVSALSALVYFIYGM